MAAALLDEKRRWRQEEEEEEEEEEEDLWGRMKGQGGGIGKGDSLIKNNEVAGTAVTMRGAAMCLQ